MDWRIKVIGHWVISIFPGLGYPVQRYVTRSLPINAASFAEHVSAAERHFALANRYLGRAPGNALEFGAGWDLVVPLALSNRIPRQTVVDVRRLARADLIADAAGRLGVGNDLASLGIRYEAPVDLAHASWSAEQFDFVHSTETIEHVPIRELPDLLSACGRLLKDGGIFSALVDYTDHYSHVDRRLGTFNFLRYGDRTWRVLNPPSHHQSRIRHRALVDLIGRAGFRVLETTESLVDGEVASAWIVATPRGNAIG